MSDIGGRRPATGARPGGLPAAAQPAELRRAGPADLAAIVAMRIEFERITRDSGSMDEAARRMELAALLGPDLESGRLLAWIAHRGGRPVGQAALRLLGSGQGGEGELLNVYVAPDERRRGLGRALVAAALAEARSLGLGRITLQPTEDSRRLYESLGFAPPRDAERDADEDLLLRL